jgi:CRISPR-associated protein Cas5h
MEILSFKIKGKLAHFRKYYANNTAFSFTIPPRTALMGIIAATMGKQKDTYYEEFASENLKLGIRVLSPLKKGFHRLNFLSLKSTGDMAKKWSSDFRGEGGRIQTPFEVVSGWNIGKDDVVFQVFVTNNESGNEVFDSIKNHFLYKEPVYNLSFGTANFNASISEIEVLPPDSIEVVESREFVLIHSAIPTDQVEELKFDKDEFESYNFVEEDMMPGDFVGDGNREVRKMNKLLFSTTPNPLRVKVLGKYYQVKLPDENINIQFMDA